MADFAAMIAGLGNPGAKYAKNRHNAGMLAFDLLKGRLDGVSKGRRGQSEIFYSEFLRDDGLKMDVYLARPLSFMNLSGEAIVPALKFYKIPVSRFLVMHDEIEIPFADIRLKKGGGHKGHNGLRDIIAHLGSADFHRLRIGVGRPDHDDVASHVLSNFNDDEMGRMDTLLEKSCGIALEWLNLLRVE